MKLLDGVTGPIRRVSQAVASAGKSMEASKKNADDFFKKSADLRHATENVSRFAEKARHAVSEVVGAWEPFESAMARVKATTGATSAEFAELSEAASSVGSRGRFSGVEAAKGMEMMRAEGMSVTDILMNIRVAESAAIASDTSLGEVISSTTGVMDAFGKSASDMAMVIDLTTVAAQQGGTPVANMRAALEGSGQAAVEAGIGIERVAAMAALLAQKSVDGGRAAAALERVMKAFTRPVGEGAQVIKQLGVNTIETVGGIKKMRDPLAILTDLQDKMTKRGVSSNNQMRALTALFGGAAPDIAAMMRAAREPGMEQLTESLKNVTGATSALSDEMGNTGAESAKKLNGAIEELEKTMGEALGPAVSGVRNAVRGAVVSFTNWMRENPKLASAMGMAAVAIAGVTTAIAGLMSTVATYVATKGLMTLAFGAGKFGIALGAAMAPALAFTAMIVGLGLAVAQLSKAWGTFNIGETWDGVKDALGDGSFIKTMTLNPFSGLGADTESGPAGGSLSASDAPRGLIEVKVDVDGGRATVKKPQATGIDLEASAGLMMSGG